MKKWISCLSRQESVNEEKKVRRRMVIVGDGECGKTCLVTRMSTGRFVDNGYLPTVFETEVIDVFTGNEKVELLVYDTAGQEDYDRLRPFSYNDIDVVLICFSLTEPDSLVNVADKWSPEIRYFCGKVPVILVGNKKDLRDAPQMETALYTPPRSSSAPPQYTDETSHSQGEVENEAIKSDTVIETNPFANLSTRSLYKASMPDLQTAYMSFRRPHYRHHAPVKHSEGALMARRIGAIAYFETSALSGDNVDELLLATTKAAVLGNKKAKKFKPLVDTLKSWQSGPLR